MVLTDQAARETIAKKLEFNLMVEAGAGSGKTEEMANRILALISTGYRSINEIVAITFTRKAANELRERVRTMLRKEYDRSGNALQKEALNRMHECFIGTIHAFCGKLLRERPIEAGIDPDFEQIDEAKDHFTRQKIWETYVIQAAEEETGILHLMDVFGVRESVAKNFLKCVCENQDVQFILPDEPEISFDELMQAVRYAVITLRKSVNAYYHHIPADVIRRASIGDGLQKSMMAFRDKLRDEKPEELSDGESVQLMMVFSKKSSVQVTQKNWGDSKEEKAYAKEIGLHFADMQVSLLFPLLDAINAFVYNSILIPFATKAKKIYDKYKHTVAELNYQDLLMQTSEMLRDFPEVRQYFQSRYKTLLIDEFQDTDPIQIGISMYLTGKELGEKRWNWITPKEGSLFVVGDPKQSIYGFRRADFSMYRRYKEHMEKTDGKIIELHTNFRAVHQLGNWFNNAFAVLFNDEEQAAFSEMDAVMPMKDGDLAGVTYYRIEAKTAAQIMEKEPESLAGIIRHLVDRKEITAPSGIDGDGRLIYQKRPVRYRDIMVLAMKKKQLETIGNGIAELGIPVRISGADITKRTGAFISFRDLIRMLAYPEENAYVYNVMNGDFFRLSDQEIYRYSHLGGKFSIYFDFDMFFEENTLNDEEFRTFQRVKTCFAKLKLFLDYIKNLSPAAAAERMIDELGIMRMHLTSGEKIAGLGSFISLIEKIRLKTITDIWGLDLFINELSLMIENGFEEDVDIEGKDFNAVRVMNTHKAKGLEAPIVILCAPYSGRAIHPSFYTECIVDEDLREQYYGYARLAKNPDWPFAGQYYAPAGWNTVEGKAKKKEELERDRLLYVAATRAKNLLIIGDSAAKENPWGKLVRLIPEGTANILEDVYSEEADTTVSASGSTPPDAADMETKLVAIKSSRDTAFIMNQPTFGMYTPSENSSRRRDFDDEYDVSHEMAKLILENTMTITINGEEAQIKNDRLAIGTIIHKLLEVLIKDEPALSDCIAAIVDATKEMYVTKEFLESVIDAFKSRKLYERIRRAETVYTEAPFSYKVLAGGVYAGNTFTQDTYINGVIDLVFKEDGKWVIVDYKTYEENEASHDIWKIYEPQLNAYKDVWENITGEAVSETEIFFIMKRLSGQTEYE